MDNNIYQLEQNAILNFILDERFFKDWEFNDKNSKIADLEIFITPECNQKCEYCYLHKRSHELYPLELLNHDNLIEKLHILLTYLLEKNYHISETELFSGEIWHTDFGVEILEIILSYLEKGLQIDSIIIPSNGYFIKENSTLNKIQTLINKYKRIKKNLLFSLSIDGAIVENESRPLNNGEKKENDFYERAFSFAIKNEFFFHPMISAKNVNKWIENHKWFYKKLSEYGSPEALDFMTLEVRNDDWTDENIEDYAKFLKYNMIRYKKDSIYILSFCIDIKYNMLYMLIIS